MIIAKADSKAKLVLEKLIQTLNDAQTLYYDGRKIGPKSSVTLQKYYLKNDNGIIRIRVESSATVSGMNITTTFIKNENGIWEVLADQVCEVSKVFTSDQLLGVFPFFRLFSCLQHPYVLDLSEENLGGTECFIINGKLSNAPSANAPDIAKEFTYTIGKMDGLLDSIHEMTFGKRLIDLELEKLELNQVLNPALFELPDKPKIIASSLDQYLDLRNQEMAKRLRE
jgi:hypothetical protein